MQDICRSERARLLPVTGAAGAEDDGDNQPYAAIRSPRPARAAACHFSKEIKQCLSPSLQIDGLSKTFHVAKSASGNTRLKALDGISLTVGRGRPWASWVSPAAESPRWPGP